MAIPASIYLYRIIHIDNLKYIIDKGLITCPTHEEADQDYTGIGDQSLKTHRREKKISLPPYGTFSEYVAFYFGNRSPMLYEICHGYKGVTKRNQEEIIYLVTSFEKIEQLNLPYVFFDGHGYHNLSQILNNRKDLDQIDWDIINAKKWNDTEEDPDRKRRKQAEMLIYRHLPIEAIIGIATYNETSLAKVNEIMNDSTQDIKTLTVPKWFY